MSPNKPESEKLKDYTEAMDKLSPDEQLRKMKAVKSEKTLLRFLSEDAPARLITRFSARVKEIVDPNRKLTLFEYGRILLANGDGDAALEVFALANSNGEDRALFYMGKILLQTDRVDQGIQCLSLALSSKKMFDEAASYLGEFFLRNGDSARALYCFNRGYKEGAKNRRSYYASRIASIEGHKEGTLEPLEEQMMAGNEDAAMALMQHYSDKSDIEGLIRIQKALTKIGHTRFYYGLARTYEMMDQHEQAIGFYQKAVEAGHHNSYLKYFALLIRMHRDQEAIKVALQAIENGYEEIYPVAIHACNTYHMYKDSLLFLDSALKSGYTHVQDILRSSKRHGPIFHALKIAFEKALAYGQDFDDQLYAYFFTDSEPDDDRPSGPMN